MEPLRFIGMRIENIIKNRLRILLLLCNIAYCDQSISNECKKINESSVHNLYGVWAIDSASPDRILIMKNGESENPIIAWTFFNSNVFIAQRVKCRNGTCTIYEMLRSGKQQKTLVLGTQCAGEIVLLDSDIKNDPYANVGPGIGKTLKKIRPISAQDREYLQEMLRGKNEAAPEIEML